MLGGFLYSGVTDLPRGLFMLGYQESTGDPCVLSNIILKDFVIFFLVSALKKD